MTVLQGTPEPGAPLSRRHARRFSLRAPDGACRRASAIAAARGRRYRQLTPVLLGVG
jgi:hypothetical protein